jgi:toxin FitB
MFEYLVDTNVISETVKAQPDPNVAAWLATQSPIRLASISLYELARGIEQIAAGRKRRFLEQWLGTLLAGNVEVVPFDEAAALTAASLEREARRLGRPVPERDLFILATAKCRGMRLATRNVDDFRTGGVPLYDPFGNVHTP